MIQAPPGWYATLLVGVSAAGYWTLLGWPIARRVMPPAIPAVFVSTLLGWAVHTAVAATCLNWIGLHRAGLLIVASSLLGAVWLAHARLPLAGPATARPRVRQLLPATLPATLITTLLAACLACAIAAAVLPKDAPDGVRLAAPMFDHSKVAIVNAIVRAGLPVANPFYGAADSPPHLAYYYWWHLSAAGVARVYGVGGWTADAALTWVTAYATLMLMAGIGAALGGMANAALAMLLAIPGSLRPLLAPLEQSGWLLPRTGLGAWVNQASWAPQHVAASGCLILSALVLAASVEGPAAASGMSGVLVLGCLVATGFGSSAWVGGIVAALALPAVLLLIAVPLERPARRRLLIRGALGACLALVLASPLLRDQAGMLGRGGGPLAFAIYPVFGPAAPRSLRPLLDALGFPLLLLIEAPACVLLAVATPAMFRRGAPVWQPALAVVALAGASVCWCLRSTIENNDLGWRAILPFLLVAIPCAAAAIRTRRRAVTLPMLLLALLGLAGAWPMLRNNWDGQPMADPAFTASAPAWSALTRLSGMSERVASDTHLAAMETPWPADIAWALLSDRPSCYSGWATAHPFTSVTAASLYRTDQELRRVFDGAPRPGDLADMVARLNCRTALLTRASPAWAHDPFAADPAWSLVAADPLAWRLYRARGAPATSVRP